MTWRRVGIAVLLCSGLLGGCSGGQTGQPTSAPCQNAPPPNEDLEGTSAQQVIDLLSGDHAATLYWVGEKSEPLPVVLHIGQSGFDSSLGLCGMVLLDVDCSLSLDNGDVLAAGRAQVRAPIGQLLPATLELDAPQSAVHAAFSGTAAHMKIEGNVEPVGLGAAAIFSNDDTGAAGAGDH